MENRTQAVTRESESVALDWSDGVSPAAAAARPRSSAKAVGRTTPRQATNSTPIVAFVCAQRRASEEGPGETRSGPHRVHRPQRKPRQQRKAGVACETIWWACSAAQARPLRAAAQGDASPVAKRMNGALRAMGAVRDRGVPYADLAPAPASRQCLRAAKALGG